MGSSAVLTSVRRLRGLLSVQHHAEASDEQLLNAFLSNRDDSAFAVLVRRHGPMVLRVCRRVLGHQQDAEDAFQAAFLVLARNAATLRNKQSLVSWLYGTAYRTALRAKQSAARRRNHEARVSSRSPADPTEELSWREVRTLLDEEIARLPEKYQSVFILCCLEEMSRAEAARRLGLTEAALVKRLATARKWLRQRLARRGVELTAALAAIAVATPSASALPAGLVPTTIKGALSMVQGQATAAAISAPVADLMRSAAPAMIPSKMKIAAAMLLALGVLAGAGWWQTAGENQLAQASSAAPQAPRQTKSDEIHGRVLDPDGKPKAGAKLLLLAHGPDRKVTELAVSAEDGRFRFAAPKVKEDEPWPALIAQADGAGLDFFDLGQWKSGKPIELRLVKDRPVRGRIVNTEGKPVAGARLTVENIGIGDNKSMDSFLTQWKKKSPWGKLPHGGAHFMAPLASERRPGALLSATTDADGRFTFRGLGEERLILLHARGAGIADKEIWIINRGGFDPQPYNQAMLDNIPKGFEGHAFRVMLHGPEASVIAEAEKVIRGIVKDADSGKGLPNAVVRLSHAEGRVAEVQLQATTDAEGRYEIRGAHKGKFYDLQFAGDCTAGYMPSVAHVVDTPGYQPVTADIRVKKGVIITGKMIDGATGKPIRGFIDTAVLVGNPFAKEFPPFDVSGWLVRLETDADGNFRAVVIPGPVLLMGGPRDFKEGYRYKPVAPDPKYPQYFDNAFGPDFPAYLDYRGGTAPIQGRFCKVLEIKPDARIIQQHIVLERATVLPVRIQDAAGKPLSGVWVAGSSSRRAEPAIRCEKAECSVYQLEPSKPRLLVFFHAERKLVGTLTLKGDEKPPIAVKLGPAGALKGRLLDANGKPLAGVVVDLQYRQRTAEAIHSVIHRAKQIVSDANGTFALDDLIPGQKFALSFRQGKRRFEQAAAAGEEKLLQVKPGERRGLGDVRVKPPR